MEGGQFRSRRRLAVARVWTRVVTATCRMRERVSDGSTASAAFFSNARYTFRRSDENSRSTIARLPRQREILSARSISRWNRTYTRGYRLPELSPHPRVILDRCCDTNARIFFFFFFVTWYTLRSSNVISRAAAIDGPLFIRRTSSLPQVGVARDDVVPT